jgi:hypothetical protein
MNSVVHGLFSVTFAEIGLDLQGMFEGLELMVSLELKLGGLGFGVLCQLSFKSGVNFGKMGSLPNCDLLVGRGESSGGGGVDPLSKGMVGGDGFMGNAVCEGSVDGIACSTEPLIDVVIDVEEGLVKGLFDEVSNHRILDLRHAVQGPYVKVLG